MARNYKRDAKGKFAKANAGKKVSPRKAARKAYLDGVGDSTVTKLYLRDDWDKGSMSDRGKLKAVSKTTYTRRQVRSVNRATFAGAVAGSAVLPGPGTIAGALAGRKIGRSPKKNQPKVTTRTYNRT